MGSLIDAQVYQVLLIQVLSEQDATQETSEEKLRTLAGRLFGTDHNFRQGIAASLGAVKNKCAGQTLDQAFDYFMQHYPGLKYTGVRGNRLQSEIGREYIRLYLQKWFGEPQR